MVVSGGFLLFYAITALTIMIHSLTTRSSSATHNPISLYRSRALYGACLFAVRMGSYVLYQSKVVVAAVL
jgi:hypothetical protein